MRLYHRCNNHIGFGSNSAESALKCIAVRFVRLFSREGYLSQAFKGSFSVTCERMEKVRIAVKRLLP